MSIRVRVLQANHGDCTLVTHEGHEGVFNVLIDGGNSATFRKGTPPKHKGPLCILLNELKANGQFIDLLVLTHIDDDHIGGLLSAFKAPDYLRKMVKKIWFNSSRLITDHFNLPNIPQNAVPVIVDSPDTSVRQAKSLESILDDIGCPRAPLIRSGDFIKCGPFTFDILSPDEASLRKLLRVWPEEKSSPDTSVVTDYHLSYKQIIDDDSFVSDISVANGSSIAFILRADKAALLFLGDAHDSVVVSALRKLKHTSEHKLGVDLVKVSHHGSQYNTSREFLSLVESERFIVSTSGAIHGLPNKRTIARILESSNGFVLFNYDKIIRKLRLPSEETLYAGRLIGLDQELVLL
ncbi:ComEC/Rec2 family competence protein [Pseudomonas poae]|uniref:ComEC/Rec2 family competence protein n=1 Tax=Pseudomonas poae TaxID=200451 RepID=UPI0034D6D958